jgi:DNA-directed RNA polymerase subunit M/transcription elongation factor TFIIS
MGIEFRCGHCQCLLKVPSDAIGKSVHCPKCQHAVKVPLPENAASGVGSRAAANDEERKNYERKLAEQGKFALACPECSTVLECKNELDGTKGFCQLCGAVFKVSKTKTRTQSILRGPIFLCPQCKEVFQGSDEQQGKKGRCSSCQHVFTIELTELSAPSAQGLGAVSSKPSTSKRASNQSPPIKPAPAKPISTGPTPAKPAPSQPFQRPSPKPFDNLDQLLPPPSLPSSADFQSASIYDQPLTSAPKVRSKKVGSNKVLKAFLIGFGIFSVFGVLCCGGGSWLLYQQVLALQTASVENFQVQAPGKLVKSSKPIPNQITQSIYAPITRSEFNIAIIKANQQWEASPNSYLQRIRELDAILNESPISRCGYDGIHYQAKAIGPVPRHEGEVFGIGNDRVLVLLYINGYDHPKAQDAKVSMDRDKRSEYDKPDQFFNSLTLHSGK